MLPISTKLQTAIFRCLTWILIVILIIILLRPDWRKNTIIPNYFLFKSETSNRIPTIVHFVVGQGDRNGIEQKFSRSSPFMFVNYLNIFAARRQIHPTKLYIHYYEEPKTFWWNQTKQDSEINITLVKSHLVDSIFNRSVDHHAHRGDILRLEILLKYGGIYLDTDVLALRSFEPLLNLSDVVMAHQDDDQNTACNAVIIGKRTLHFSNDYTIPIKVFKRLAGTVIPFGIPANWH